MNLTGRGGISRTLCLTTLAVLGGLPSTARRVAAVDPATPTAPATSAATEPATRTAATEPAARTAAAVRRSESAEARAAVQAAVADLTKEFQAAFKADGTLPRTESNYFEEKPSAAVSNDAVLAALGRSYGNGPATAYVRWQLLSGLKPAADEEESKELAAALLRAYRSAPEPVQRPGIGRDQTRLDRLAQGRDQAEEADVRARFDGEVARVEAMNVPILEYRDELFERLAPSYEAYAAGFQDAIVRLDAGADVGDHADALSLGIRGWAAGSVPRQELAAMARAVNELKSRRGPQYYERVDWDANNRRLVWRKTTKRLNDNRWLDDLAEVLNTYARSAGEMKFRD